MYDLKAWLEHMNIELLPGGSLRRSIRFGVLQRISEALGIDFASTKGVHVPIPSSLRQLVQCGHSPKMESWQYAGKDEKHDGGWASNLQGLTHDGKYWYFFQEGKVMQMDGPPFEKTTDQNCMHIDHIKNDTGKAHYFHMGDGQFSLVNQQEVLYVPVEYNGDGAAMIALISLTDRYAEDDEYLFCRPASGLLRIPGTDGAMTMNTKGPWCAISPLDGLLYTSAFDGVDHLHVYDPSVLVVHDNHPLLGNPYFHSELAKYGLELMIESKSSSSLSQQLWDWSEEVGMGYFHYRGRLALWQDKVGMPSEYILNRVQGGCFSNRGHLFLTSDGGGTKGIHGFCELTGRFWNWIPKNSREVEGIAIWDRKNLGAGDVHVAYLDDNWAGQDDDADIKHWLVPDDSGVS